MMPRLVIRCVACAFMTFAFTVAADKMGATRQDPGDIPAERVYKNITVLNGIPGSKLQGAMAYMSAALGVSCQYCHTDAWDSDAKPAKLAARRMILMTRRINDENFRGARVVNCYTCHRGSSQTIAVLPVEDDPWEPAHAPKQQQKRASPLPAAEQVLDLYVRTMGGDAPLDRIRTRISKGTQTTSNHVSPPTTLPIEVHQQTPDKLLLIRTNGGLRTAVEAFDGAMGWISEDAGVRAVIGDELSRMRRDAELHRYQKLRATFSSARVLGLERIKGRDAYVVGATSSDGTQERLYFDVATGLLVRSVIVVRTVLGAMPEVIEFDDYREVDGVKLPFALKLSRPPFVIIRKFKSIEHNVEIDGSRFAKPRIR